MEKNKKIKLIFTVNDFTVAGVQKLYLDMFDFIDLKKYEIHLITLFQFPNKKDFYNQVPKHIFINKINFNNFYDIKKWFELASLLHKIKPDVVISSLFFCNTVFRVLKIFFGFKIISIEHNTYIEKTKFQIIVDRILAMVTFRIVAVSKTVATFTIKQEKISANKFEVIHNGINIEKIKRELSVFKDKTQIRESLGFKKDDHIFINVGRLTWQKNQEILVNAFGDFAKKNENYKLIILGEGNLRNKLEKLADNLLPKGQIFFLGARENIFLYYFISDYFVSTSIIEGFGIAHIEALCSGLPVLTTKTAGPDEFIREGENGYFIENNKESILFGLEKIIKIDRIDLDKRTFSSIESYSIQNTVRKYEELINRCIQK